MKHKNGDRRSANATRRRLTPPSQTYNIIPLHDLTADHYFLGASIAALRSAAAGLPKPPDVEWLPHYDLLDWLGFFFGFQPDNVRNQREHLVLHLANSQLRRHSPSGANNNTLEIDVVRCFRCHLLQNYTNWCYYLCRKPIVQTSDSPSLRRELLYVVLYLLIWGESANLRFAPECLAYIFHHMASELNQILENRNTRTPFLLSISGEKNAFLNQVVKPIYNTIRKEAQNGDGTASHMVWRNYDDINEYFWSSSCFEKLEWPINRESPFFKMPRSRRYEGKTGFVEQRSSWNIFRSFDRLWVMLVLFLQAAIIVAWEQEANKHKYPWQTLKSRDYQVKLLTLFCTWSGIRLLKSVLDMAMLYRLVLRENSWLYVKAFMKTVVSGVWLVVFLILYRNIWTQRNHDIGWSNHANQWIKRFLLAAAVFLISHILALALSVIPWVKNFIEETNCKVVYPFTWWFHSRIFVGRGLRESLMDKVNYGLFWIFVLATKFVFSYTLQIRPMIGPTRTLLNLKDGHNVSAHRFAVGLMWLPVVLIYLMDMQIWYSIYSSLVGAAVGTFHRLGNIQNMKQVRLRFQLFARQIQLKLMPTGSSNLEADNGSSNLEADKFAMIWNEVITTFREEDIVRDDEVELLEVPKKAWNVRVIRWPCILLCNELLQALDQAKELASLPDKLAWQKICKNEYRRCAVVEAYDSIKYLLLEIIKRKTKERSIVKALFEGIDGSIQNGKFTKTYNTSALPKIHEKMISLMILLIQPEKTDLEKVGTVVKALYKTAIDDFRKVERSTGLLFQNAVQLPNAEDEIFYRQVRRLHTIFTCKDGMHNVPRNLEARRRIAFFSNSLFMAMPHAPEVKKMLAFSVLTPYYNEEVLYNKEQLQTKTEDGVSTLFYLQTVYADEWENFMERMRREGMENDNEIWDSKLRDVRLWASYRGQTLARTVRGMMYYNRALKMLAFLDSASEKDVSERAWDIFRRKGKGWGGGGLPDIASMKFTYVVACQTYDAHKAKRNPKDRDILFLMKKNEAIRVAYVDEVSTENSGKEYFSVLVKYDHQRKKEVEIYRVKLPGRPKVGEGKPENQNHALIFTRGDAVQTIDMNQDNYFEEALKMRNLLEEFERNYGLRKPTILGVREHIFTGSVSPLASFMSSQETSFVTLGQRVLANPLKVRMHYGHPDVFDRFWFLTRGGISKASKAINISEDIYAGFNCMLRGGNVTHHEYIQVGKGREVGLSQITMFEAKVASGNGQQVLSRDVYRLGHRLDFFRMLSFFFTTVGFYFNTMLAVLAVYAFLWGQLHICFSGVEGSAFADDNSHNRALATILNQQFVILWGWFTALPMIMENTVEQGFFRAVWDFITMQFQLSSVFYTFSTGTRAHYFGRTILHNGAKYRATGRGFAVQHKRFAEIYRHYARSHFVKAIELGLIMIIYATYSPVPKRTFVYIALTISTWPIVISWIMAPFVFNPMGFALRKTVDDLHDFMKWIWYPGGLSVKPEQSWEAWWKEEHDHLRTTGLWGKAVEVVLNLRFLYFQYGIVYHLRIANGSTSIKVYLLSWICIFVAIFVFVILSYARDKYLARQRIRYRLVQFLVLVLLILVIVLLLKLTSFKWVDLFTSLVAFVPTGWGLISIALVHQRSLQRTAAWNVLMFMARFYDIMFGMIVMAPVALLSLIPGLQSMQARLLFKDACIQQLKKT